MSEQFPQYTITNNVASIPLRARNGYVHVLRVPADGSNVPAKNALPLLQRLWPFMVSTFVNHKKILKDGVPVHHYWLEAVYNTVVEDFDYKPRCRNHDWLDWTDGNIYVLWDESQRQKTFDAQTYYHGNIISPASRDILLARSAKPSQVCERGDGKEVDPDVLAIFEEAQNVPRRSARVSVTSTALAPGKPSTFYGRKEYDARNDEGMGQFL